MGLTVLGAGVIIGFLDEADVHHLASEQFLRDCRDVREDLAIPASVFAEILVGPSRTGPPAVEVVLDLIARLPLRVIPLDDQIAVVAASVRARHKRVRLPDALVLATAQCVRADRLATTDLRWPSAKAMKVDFEIVPITSSGPDVPDDADSDGDPSSQGLPMVS